MADEIDYDDILDRFRVLENMLSAARKIVSTKTAAGLQLGQFYIQPAEEGLRALSVKIDQALEAAEEEN